METNAATPMTWMKRWSEFRTTSCTGPVKSVLKDHYGMRSECIEGTQAKDCIENTRAEDGSLPKLSVFLVLFLAVVTV